MILLELDPNVVKPGWTALIVTLLLALAVVVLFLSMRQRIRKIDLPYRDEIDEASPDRQDVSTPEDPPTR